MPRQKFTKEIINQKLAHRFIEMIGDYVNSQTKTQFRCRDGHIWESGASGVIAGRGCPQCYLNNKTNTKEEFIKRLPSNIKLVDDYVSSTTKSKFECDNHHTWYTEPRAIKGCPECATINKTLSKDDINKRLINEGKNFRITGDYINSYTKTEFTCSENHIWEAQYNHISNCPGCSLGGGYKKFKSGYIYILDFGNFIKYGITNNLDKRLVEHRRYSEFSVIKTKFYEDGRIAQNWERDIKIIFGGNYVTKDIMPNGHTETLSRDRLGDLLKTIL